MAKKENITSISTYSHSHQSQFKKNVCFLLTTLSSIRSPLSPPQKTYWMFSDNHATHVSPQLVSPQGYVGRKVAHASEQGGRKMAVGKPFIMIFLHHVFQVANMFSMKHVNGRIYVYNTSII